MKPWHYWLLCGLIISSVGCGSRDRSHTVVVGAKKFTESVLLAEMGVALASEADAFAQRDDVGGTAALWVALTNGDIDVYPEYTGTITHQILQAEPDDLREALAVHGIAMSNSLGFNNNYALGMRKDKAASLGISTISDLRNHPKLQFGFTHEFIDREDGWPGVRERYNLPQTDVKGFNHSLAYRALVEDAIDVMELYTTDGEIVSFDLVVLEDDLNFFPVYEAVWLYRADLLERQPNVVAELLKLEGQISEQAMQEMNAEVQTDKSNEVEVARAFLRDQLGVSVTLAPADDLSHRLARSTREHLTLVIPSLLAAVLVAVPLGVVAARRPRLGQVILAMTGIIQTIPSLAMLLFMIPVMKFLFDQGIGVYPAVAALFLYSLLPIVRNTYSGISGIAGSLRESTEVLGLSRWAILWRIELPLAAPTILAGVKTAAVINVGTATLGGFIGAGGYGRPILRGLDKSDMSLMLEGAIPAAVLALLVQAVFELIEYSISPRR